MMPITPVLSQVLSDNQVQVVQPRSHLVQLAAVPVGLDFNKTCSNVLFRRRTEQNTWDAFVDEDLAYTGRDATKAKLFSGVGQRRWLALTAPAPLPDDINEAIVRVLAWLDSPMCNQLSLVRKAPVLSRPGELEPALDRHVRFLSEEELGEPFLEPLTSQAEAVLRTAEIVTRTLTPVSPLLWGPSGCGKTRVARWAAARLVRKGLVSAVLEVRAASLCAGAMIWPERDERLRQILDLLLTRKKTLVLLEQADLALMRSEIAHALFADGLDRGLRIIGIARPEFTPEWLAAGCSLERRVELVAVRQPEIAELRRLLEQHLQEHPLVKNRELADAVIPAVLTLAKRRPGANPAAALGLLDAVLNHAEWCERQCIGPDDVFHLIDNDDDNEE
jgi:ATPase family protein associated with various cellular activities (AAA)